MNRQPSFPSRLTSRESGSVAVSFPAAGEDCDSDDSQKKKRRRLATATRELFQTRKGCCCPKWVGILLLLLCLRLVIYSISESNSANRDPYMIASGEIRKPGSAKSNLNNLEMPTRRRNGTVEPCLKLLPVKGIENLSFPPPRSDNVIKHLQYLTYYDNDPELVEESGGQALAFQPNRSTNLFTGNLSSSTRSASYKIGETVAVHCGFCDAQGGFEMSAADRQYLSECNAAVVTCIFGGGDDLYQPVGMSDASLKKVCYVAFWDNVTMQVMQERGIYPHSGSRKFGHWRIVVVNNLPFSDQRRNGKIPKMLSHRLFPNARYSVWVDSKSQFRRDPMGVFETLLWRPQAMLAISQHGARDCVYAEGQAIVEKHKATPEEVAAQLGQYEAEGLPRKFQVDGHKALAEASVIVREHTPRTNLFMCLWFNEVALFTARDQLSFVYVLSRLPLPGINMFPVCTRKALVNSLGHKAKVNEEETHRVNWAPRYHPCGRGYPRSMKDDLTRRGYPSLYEKRTHKRRVMLGARKIICMGDWHAHKCMECREVCCPGGLVGSQRRRRK